MSTSLTDNPAVQQLAKIFDLELPKGHRMVVTEWEYEYKSDHPEQRIIISKIEVYDTDNNFVKEADLSKLRDNMHKFSFVFKKMEAEYCNKDKWGDCECSEVCKRGFVISR